MINTIDLKDLINQPETRDAVNIIETRDAALFEYLKNNKSINLNLIDELNSFYITLKYKNEYLNIPFSYIIINTNKKLNGIPYINFETTCSSKARGLCPISETCYSLRDQHRFKNNNFKIILNVLFFKEVQKNPELYNITVKYLQKFNIIRYNCNNDFKTLNNYKFLCKLSQDVPAANIGGYTKRTDLIKEFEKINKPDNLILNGSGFLFDNNYKTTTNLKEYINNNYKCLNGCNNCLKCFNPCKKTIINLLHGPLNIIDKYYNTEDNRTYLIKIFNRINIQLTHKQLTINQGLLSSLNKALKNQDIKIKNYKELTNIIKSVIN